MMLHRPRPPGGASGDHCGAACTSISSSRRALVLVLLLLLSLCVSPRVEAAMTFTTSNVVEASLYQTIQVDIQSVPLQGDPAITTGDQLYFITSTGNTAAECIVNPAEGVVVFPVTSTSSEGFTGTSSITITTDAFAVGSTYVGCYIAKATTPATAQVLPRGFTTGAAVLQVWPAIYTTYTLSPAAPSGGEGAITLTVATDAQQGRPANSGLSASSTLLLIPCSGATTCTNLNALTSTCGIVGAQVAAGTTPAGVVPLIYTRNVAGTFVAPYAPPALGYAICIPYCGDSTLANGCASTSTSMAYTLVANTKMVVVSPANPGTYTRTPLRPQAREEGTMTFVGTGLSTADAVKVIRAGQSCPSSSSSILANLNVGDLVQVDATTVSCPFFAPNLLTQDVVGQVCYRRASTALWAPVYLNADTTVADFTLAVLQPTGFTVVPAAPTVGSVMTLTFTGSGLNAEADDAFLTASTDVNPCATTEGDLVFACEMGGETATPTCTSVAYTLTQATTLFVCYQKAGMTNYAQIAGEIDLLPRNPTFSITPYPFFAGQGAALVFVGVGLSASDTVELIDEGGMCGTSTPSARVSLSSVTEVQPGTSYSYTIVGMASACLTACYRLRGSTDWIFTQPSAQTVAPVDGCPGTDIFISPFPVRYRLGLPTGASLTAKETTTMQFINANAASSAASSITVVKLLQAENACVTELCNGAAVCSAAAQPGDFVSATVSAANSVNMMINTAGENYIVCVQSTSAGGGFVPVLPATAESSNSTDYGLTAAQPNPLLLSSSPQPWRVAVAGLLSTFSGTALQPTTDAIYPVADGVLLASGVCPPPSALPAQTMLSAVINTTTSTATSVKVDYYGSSNLRVGQTVNLCYQWSTNGVIRVTYTGSRVVESPVPSSATWSLLPDTGIYRAGMPNLATISSNTTELDAASDSVFFYRYVQSANPNPSCFCDPVSCAFGTLVSYSSSSLTQDGDDTVLYTSPLGFNNYDYAAIYVVCYNVNALAITTYSGRLTVGMANPTFYSAATTSGSSAVAGSLFSITATRRCLTTGCVALSAADELILIDDTTTCSATFSTDGASKKVQPIGNPTVPAGGLSYRQSFVTTAAGSFRVCYRLAAEAAEKTSFNDLPRTSGFLRTSFVVGAANPSAFASVPALPTSGQFLTINLVCSASVCTSCVAVRLVPGADASCWANVPGTYSSVDCAATLSVQFPGQFVPSGDYTVCYGSSSSFSSNRRVPGVLTVANANPASYLPAKGEGREIVTNQNADYVLDVVGTGLSVNDAIFFLPANGTFTCHDLETDIIQSNSTIAGWLSPSIDPNPLVITATGVSWVASSQSKRFGSGMLYDELICGQPGEGQPCAMELCYLRNGQTWAPVPIENPPSVSVVESNPSSVAFDSYPLVEQMYAMATVTGKDLLADDTLVIQSASCAGEALSVSVGDGWVSKDGTEWRGVLRFNNSAAGYAVCYWHQGSPVEILTVLFPGNENSAVAISQGALYYVYPSTNFSSSRYPISQYEELMVGGSFFNDGQRVLTLSEGRLISGTTECNYAPFFDATGIKPTFPVVEVLSATEDVRFRQARLMVGPGELYALCLVTPSGLFRVTSPPPKSTKEVDATGLSIAAVNPMTFVPEPLLPMAGQNVSLTLTPAEGHTAATPLQVGDVVHLIDGSLFECGFLNATVVAEGAITAVTTALQATISFVIPGDLTTMEEVGADGVTTTVTVERNLTVCYQLEGGSFATVPRGDALDRNLRIVPSIPSVWASEPQQAEVMAPLVLTFMGNETMPDYLTTKDVAFLVKATNGMDTPSSQLCASAPHAYTSKKLTLDGINTQWSIAEQVLEAGTYVVCYTAVENGQPVYVANPTYLIIYPLQSPTGAYTDRGGLTAFQGERFFLFFNTSVPLNIVLDDGTGNPAAAAEEGAPDVVRISPTMDCQNPLVSPAVDAIPTNFGYGAPLVNLDNAPYAHLILRAAVGSYFVCMRRAGRASWELYYDFRVVGGYVNTAELTLTAAPITTFATVPTSPRVGVPSTAVTLTYVDGTTVADLEQVFFVKEVATPATTPWTIASNPCYLPATRAEAASATVVLVDNTLQVLIPDPPTADPLLTEYPYPSSGAFLLCYQLRGRFIASVSPTALDVLVAAPTSYTVPALIAVENAFTMTITATDPIFATGETNVAQLYPIADPQAVPSCVGATPPVGGVTHFTTFTPTSAAAIAATVQPQLVTKGYYYLCFLTSGQTHDVAVPNQAGGYVFSVGMNGPQRYSVLPSPAYVGQELSLTITGNQLSNADHVKIINATDLDVADYPVACTAAAANADASTNSGGAAGTPVSSPNGIVAVYNPRVLGAGTYLLCYQSGAAAADKSWMWIAEVPSFEVDPPQPTNYVAWPEPTFATQIAQLFLHSSANLLTTKDQLKLVAKGSGTNGFDCTAAAVPSPAIGLAQLIPSLSSKSVAAFSVCGASVVDVTVCYLLAGAGNSWAEVPSSASPLAYSELSFLKSPFTGPTLTPNASPMPFQRTSLTFASSDAAMVISLLSFALAPVARCSLTIDYTTPTLYSHTATNTFEVALPFAGDYTLFLRASEDDDDYPNITHSTLLTVAGCDPCEVSPPYDFVGGTVTLDFPSTTGSSLSAKDGLRLIPTSVGLMGDPCSSTAGPYGETTFHPIDVVGPGAKASYNVSTGTQDTADDYLGEYYLCYSKSKSVNTNFYVLTSTAGSPLTFSIFPMDALAVTFCPNGDNNNLLSLETMTFNITMDDPNKFPNTGFLSGDELVALPSAVLPTGVCEDYDPPTTTTTDNATLGVAMANGEAALVPSLDTFGVGFSNWVMTLPFLKQATSYTLCFKLQYANQFHQLSDKPMVVQPPNPINFVTSPPVIVPNSVDVSITIEGTNLANTDQVFIVPVAESCAETCTRPLNPTIWNGNPYTVRFVSDTTVVVDFEGPITQVVTLGVCYRTTGFLLTRLGNIVVAQANPHYYGTSFTPRVGTQPELIFYGTGLTTADAVMLVPVMQSCLIGNAVAVGSAVSANPAVGTSTFAIPLIGDDIQANTRYTVCYQVASTAGYVAVPVPLLVFPGGPTSFVSSNLPMVGRATVLSFPADYQTQIGDAIFLACPGCSCFKTEEAVVPYGSVSATAVANTISLRVGFNTTQSYPLCYQVVGSGFGLVSMVVPTTNSPAAVEVAPLPTFQGQRLTYTFSEVSDSVPVAMGDAAMLVQAGRTCWETSSTEPNGVVVQPSDIATVGKGAEAASISTWKAHVPSLGPNVPKPDLFPLSYLLCYREAGQSEFVSVPFPFVDELMSSVSPATYNTNPEKGIPQGIVNATVVFANAAEGGAAYAVEFATLTDNVCDAAGSVVVSAPGPAYPVYALSLPTDATLGSNNVALCYTRAGATVAELPQLLTVVTSNPSGYTTNVVAGDTARERQYLEVHVMGTGLSDDEDRIAFTDVPCAAVPGPMESSTLLARLGDISTVVEGTEVVVTAQFVAPTSPISMHVCYYMNGFWREVGAPLVLQVPVPSSAEVYAVGRATSLRAGQHLFIELVGGAQTTPVGAAILSGSSDGAGTWCNNFTADDIQEPSLLIQSAALLDVPIWQHPGAARLCLHNTATSPWADVGESITAPFLMEVLPPNPSYLTSFPVVPRVGQKVTLTFHLIVAASAEDVVKLTTDSITTPCESATSMDGFAATMPVEVVDDFTTSITLTDTTDPLHYRSFNASGDVRVCYFTSSESSWAVVGGTVEAGTIVVGEQVPESWNLVGADAAILGKPFTLAFNDAEGRLNVTGDLAFAVMSGTSCGANPYDCPQCIVFSLDEALSTPQRVVTQANLSVTVGELNLCYQLYDATPALIPDALNVENGPIQCVEQSSVVVGQQQNVTFMIQEGTSVTDDSWRVSFYATSAMSCDANYVPDFLAAMATQVETTPTSVTYALQWPVSMTEERYTLCYTHKGEAGPICTCGQIDARTGECFVETLPGAPQSFSTTPFPTYVGQSITVLLELNEMWVMYPPTVIKFVRYVDPLTTCRDDAAFATPANPITKVSALEYSYTFTFDYQLGTMDLVVCALTGLSDDFAAVGLLPSLQNTTRQPSTTMWVRPYLDLTTFPSEAAYLRAQQSLNLYFTHQSHQADDLISLEDTIAFVDSPTNCNEAFINAQDVNTVMAMFVSSDTIFVTTPATVNAINAETLQSSTVATFAAAGVGTHNLCYKLSGGTWAPVLPSLAILPAVFSSCAFTSLPSPLNRVDGTDTSSERAMQFIPTTITATDAIQTLYTSNDAVRIVPQTRLCVDDSAPVFTIGTSQVQPPTSDTIKTIFFAPTVGDWKLCYRFGGTTNPSISNWSPTCGLNGLTAASPTANTVGCLNVGQTLDPTATQTDDYLFNTADRVRYVGANDPCLLPDGSTTVASTITMGDAVQSVAGQALPASASGGHTAEVPYALLLKGTTAVRLCYVDAAGNQYAIPLRVSSAPTSSTFAVQPRQPATLQLQSRRQVGQRLALNFTAAATGVTPVLVPSGPIPSPLVPGPAYDGKFDAATMLALGATPVYRDGRCTAAVRAGATLSLQGVYGAATAPPYVMGVYDPKTPQFFIACYRLAECGVEDSGSAASVDPYNPSSTSTIQAAPRRGQLITVNFQRDTTSSTAALLSPGADRADYALNLDSCWTLANNAGTLVSGSSQATNFVTFFAAQSPATAVASTPTRSCYKLVDGSWSELPDGVSTLLAANPVAFTTTPPTARQNQLNHIDFVGKAGLSEGDVVKIIPLSLNCSADALPAAGVQGWSASSTPLPSSADGWPITRFLSATTSSMTFSASNSGSYSVCYRLATDTVWTLVYGDLIIAEKNPAQVIQHPVSTLESEPFTLNFTAATGASLSAADRVVLYAGDDINCADPGTVDEINMGPSRTDLLPSQLGYAFSVAERGNYTLCYLLNTGTDQTTIVWGFPIIVVGPNPTSVAAFPSGAQALRALELISLVFDGFGLSSAEGKSDAVKLIDGTLPATQLSCLNANPATGVTNYPLYANGTNAVQVWRTTASAASYWVCYKLNGGFYHMLGTTTPVRVTSVAIPSAATSPKFGAPVSDGESMTWTISGNTACDAADVVFYSTLDCDDVAYYDTSAITANSFPNGASSMGSNCGGTTSSSIAVRLGSSVSSSEEDDDATTAASLCYFRATDRTVTVLQSDSIQVQQGSPAVLASPISVTAQQVFGFTLDVTPGPTDYVVLVTDPSTCVGVTAPTNQAIFTSTAFNAGTSLLEVTAAVPASGTYAICYSHQVGICAASKKRDCARVVGTVMAGGASPSGWFSSPTTLYTSSTAVVTFQGVSAESQSTAVAWMALLPSTNTVAAMAEEGGAEMAWAVAEDDAATAATTTTNTMEQVNDVCQAPRGATSITLAYDPTTQQWSSPSRLLAVASYALCYLPSGTSLSPPAAPQLPLVLFPPAEHAGPTVLLTTVTSATFTDTPIVGSDATVVLQGGGLAQDDVLTAVAPPANTKDLPDDVCSNVSYTPRVTAHASTSGYGLTTILRTMTFATSGSYVLCYHPAAAGASPATLISNTIITVMPQVLSVSVVTSPVVVEVPVELRFSGSSLSTTNLVALPFVGKMSADEINVASVCGPTSSATYAPMTSAAVDGSSAFFTTTPEEAGPHMVCFKQSSSSDTILLSTVVEVQRQDAVEAAFQVQPSDCAAYFMCGVSPVVALLNSSGSPTSSPGVAVAMYLVDATTAERVPDGVVADESFVESPAGVFTFVALRISTAGTYRMVVNFTLAGGQHSLVATSANFEVAKNNAPTNSFARLVCVPNGGVLPTSTTPMQCTVTTLISTVISNFPYAVAVSSGSATACAYASAEARACTFTVTPAPLTNYQLVVVRPGSPYDTWPVENSPLTAYLPTFPEPMTTLQCGAATTTNGNVLALPSLMVREGSTLSCQIQGKATVGGVTMNVVALVDDLRAQFSVDGRPATSLTVGPLPASLDGMYEVNLTVPASLELAVQGYVRAQPNAESWLDMTGSPVGFTVLGVPTTASTLSCHASLTGSTLWFSPLGEVSCVLQLRNANGPINGASTDYLVSMPKGGSAQPIPSSYGTELSITASAPSPLTTWQGDAQAFAVEAEYLMTQAIISTYTGSLVFANKIVSQSATFTAGSSGVVVFSGSGLQTSHLYLISTTPTCADAQKVSASNEGQAAGTITLSFTVPDATNFFFCFIPEDARLSNTATAAPLSPTAFVVSHGGKHSGWTTGDLILLIVGACLLFILLVLFLILLWRLCCHAPAATRHHAYRDVDAPTAPTSAMPRTNDRYVSLPPPPLAPVPAPAPAPVVAAAATPAQPPMDHLRIHIAEEQRPPQQPPSVPAPLAAAGGAGVKNILAPAPLTDVTAAPPAAAAAGTPHGRRRRSSGSRHSKSRYVDVDGTSDLSASTTLGSTPQATGRRRTPVLPPPLPHAAAAVPPPPLTPPPTVGPPFIAPPPSGSAAMPPGLPPLPSSLASTQPAPAAAPAPAPAQPTTAAPSPVIGPVSGPYQHLHYPSPGASTTQAAISPNPTLVAAPLSASGDVVPANLRPSNELPPLPPTPMGTASLSGSVGPFVVAGHTSRPMVRAKRSQ